MLKKKITKWMMLFGLFFAGLILPTSAYSYQGGQPGESNQRLWIIIDQVKTNYDLIAGNEAQFRLVAQSRVIDPSSNASDDQLENEPKASPSCGGPQIVPKEQMVNLTEPIRFDYDVSTIKDKQIVIDYFAFEDNLLGGSAQNKLPFIPSTCPDQNSVTEEAASEALIRFAVMELIKLAIDQFKDKTYGYGNIIVTEGDNGWRANEERIEDSSDGLRNRGDVAVELLQEAITRGFLATIVDTFIKDTPKVLEIKYCVRLTGGDDPAPNSCKKDDSHIGIPLPNNDPPGNDTPGSNPNPEDDSRIGNPLPNNDSDNTPGSDLDPNDTTCNGYMVQAGENFFDIAARLRINPHYLRVFNRIPYPPYVYAGQCLRLPGQALNPAFSPDTGATCNGYVVQPGENLFNIAARLRVNPHYLRVFNRIPYPPYVYAGQCLRVPF